MLLYGGIAGLIILLLYFILPDVSGNGGYITDRLNYIFFIFILIALIKIQVNKTFLIIIIPLVLLLHFKHLLFLYNHIEYKSNRVEHLLKASSLIENNKTIVAINRSQDWLDIHTGNYLGVNKAVYIQENYEAYTGYFPIINNFKKFPELNIGLLTPYNSCIPLPQLSYHKIVNADYVLIIDTLNINNECDKSIQDNLEEYYKLLSDKKCKEFALYKLK